MLTVDYAGWSPPRLPQGTYAISIRYLVVTKIDNDRNHGGLLPKFVSHCVNTNNLFMAPYHHDFVKFPLDLF